MLLSVIAGFLISAGTAQGAGGGLWQDFLSRYVDTTFPDGINRLEYSGVTAEDSGKLATFLKEQQAVKVSALSRGAQKAFWINLYNAQVVALVLSHRPAGSIMDIRPPDGSGPGPFKWKSLEVEGSALSLDDIEHGILRPKWRDPRLHFALNCATLGCPNLPGRAFTEENIESLLNHGIRAYLGSARGAEFKGGALRLSSIFQWYPEDFGRNEPVVLAFLAQYADPRLREKFRGFTGKITYHYDWGLNGSRRPSRE